MLRTGVRRDPYAGGDSSRTPGGYGTEKEQIRQKAEAQERAAKDADEVSEKAVHHHHRWAQAVVAVQVSIALAAITLLTRRRWLQVASYG